MTREEAIEHGKEQLLIFGGEHREFIEMAIKALEQEPCKDAISRELVLREIDKYMCGVPFEKTLDVVIQELPPVTPKAKTDVLDKIRAEIADLDDADYDYEGYYKAVTDALQIIDKYKAESEDKE